MSWSYNIDLDSTKVKTMIRRMRNTREGIPTKDRPWGLRTFTHCFVGYEAVAWIAKEQNVSTEFAITIGNSLLQKGVIEHVTQDHEFKNELLFYRFREKKKVVIVGGGFAGAKLAKDLEKDYDITLIDKKDHFGCILSYPTLVVEDSNYSKIVSPHKQYLKKDSTRVVVGEVVSVDSAKQSVKLKLYSETSHEEQVEEEYDYLILATGSKYEQPFSCPLDLVVNAMDASQLRAAQDKLRRASDVVIIGGGPVSLEIAGEIAHHYGSNSNSKTARTQNDDDTIYNKRVTMLSSSRVLMERATNIQAHKSSLAFLLSNGISVLFGEKATDYDPETRELVTDRGTRLDADLIYLCVGFKPNTEFIRKSEGSELVDCIDKRGFVEVSETLQVKGFDNVFAMGDIVAINEEKLAQNAESHSDIVSSNLRSLDSGKPLKRYEPSPKTLIVSLGPNKALVVNGSHVYLDGRIASYLKSFVQFKVMHSYR